ncbi:hypothetical protein SAMN02745857_00630 [Andreprevotia lacus DSM 23236]|jgi:hypothetical protein|uniref:Uncharacterized protein n=1 Tax=Andreprevotia lacus DSM 23236 TaxID=1121001 RepID=A0A1W1X537_9NEIS|nr:hypothetical protein [Andreprevotia lacus]SMC19069.1 hypothetical protein SAMN02745857_00630 [Andreprevotia lacus DSM 23236]
MSQITLHNQTAYIAQYIINKGQQIIARLPGLAPQATLSVPVEHIYEVVATTIVDGNTYTSAPATISGATSFLAQIKQNAQQGTYDFEMVVGPSSKGDELQFQKTTLAPVTFTISENGRALQSIVVTDSFMVQTLQISDTYSIYAVINGVTTDTVTTNNPNATVSAVTDTTDLAPGYFTLVVS